MLGPARQELSEIVVCLGYSYNCGKFVGVGRGRRSLQTILPFSIIVCNRHAFQAEDMVAALTNGPAAGIASTSDCADL